MKKRLLVIGAHSGEFTVNLAYRFEGERLVIEKSGVVCTARLLSKGVVFIP